MNLVVGYEFYGCVGKDTEECCRMTLEESTKPAFSIDFEASTKCATPGSYDILSESSLRKIRIQNSYPHTSESLGWRLGKGSWLGQEGRQLFWPEVERNQDGEKKY